MREKLQRVVDYARRSSPYYRQLFAQIRLPRKIGDISRFESIPVTFRRDLEKRNDEFVAVPRSEWADLVTTSGTTGRSVYIPFTKKDVSRNAGFIASKFSVFGLRKDDTAYITVPMGQSMWIGGLSVWLGCLETGACALRAGTVGMETHMEFLARFRPTVIFGLPSYIRRLGEELAARGLSGIRPRLIVTFGENIMNRDLSRNPLGRQVERLWKTKAISGYCSSEVSPGFECVFQAGHHILREMVYVEIVDPRSQKLLKAGEEGLVVTTHFGRDGLPLIRYANGDISFLVKGRCRCGRSSHRLGPIVGRIDEMLKVKGVTICPSNIEGILRGMPSIDDFSIELFGNQGQCDRIEVRVRFKKGAGGDVERRGVQYIEAKLKDLTGIRMAVEEMGRGEKEVSFRKTHIIDRRKNIA
jgi:phenylacetate-CoA ligase